jgi:Zn-dependent metalloprotease
MKKLYKTLMILFIFSNSFTQNASRLTPFDKAYVLMDKHKSIPKQVKFSKDDTVPLSTFWTGFKKEFNLSDNNEFKMFKTFYDNLGQTHHRYKQYYKGIEITDRQYILHEQNGLVHSANGDLINIPDINITPGLSEEQALKRALTRLNAEKYMWQNPKSEAFLKKEINDRSATYFPKGQLMISSAENVNQQNNYRLVYRFDIWAEKPMWRYNVDVDAHSGEIINKNSLIYENDIQGEGQSLYNGLVQITVSDSLYPEAIPQSYWHTSHTNALGDNGQSFWLADTSALFVSGYNDLWYEVMDTEPVLIEGEDIQLSFFQRYGIENPADAPPSYNGWDGMNVRISSDNGTTWQVLDNPSPQYSSSSLYSFGNIFGEGINVPGWAGTNNEWHSVLLDLSEYSGQTVIIRFAFASDGGVSSWTNPGLFGWQVDNIEISSSDSTLYYNSGDTATVSFIKLDEGVTIVDGNYRLREQGRGDGIFTYNMKDVELMYLAVDFVDDDSSFTDPADNAGVSVHWSTEKTYDYFLEKHGRNGYDNEGGSVKSYVHYFLNTAFYLGNGVIIYGDGDGITEGPLVSLDVAGHELTHGVLQESANLIYKGESGALNESFSDIFGESVERWVEGEGDWLIAADAILEGALYRRSMIDPNSREHPDTYRGNFWAPTGPQDPDNGGVHINSGVQDYWFYLLSEGGNGVNDNGDTYSVNGIGIDDAEQIAYRNLTVYMTPTSMYDDARQGAINSASDLFGPGSDQIKAVTNAWYAVGVGDPFGNYAVNAAVNKNYLVPGSDTLILTTEVFNPDTNNMDVIAIIESFDKSILDTISLYDDGLHQDSTSGDGFWAGWWLVPPGERFYRATIVAALSDSGLFNSPGEASLLFTTVGSVQPTEEAYIDTIYNESANTQYIFLIVKNYDTNKRVEELTVTMDTKDTRIEKIIYGTRNIPDLDPGETYISTTLNFFAFKYADGYLPDSTIDNPINFEVIVSSSGYPYWKSSFEFTASKLATSIYEQSVLLPKEFVLMQNYPNPFNPKTIISYQLAMNSDVNISIYNLLGQKVATLVNKKQMAGSYTAEWDASGFASGIYYYHIKAGEFEEVNKMVLIR